LRWGALIGKNLVALLAIILGMGLALPGIPGPGLLVALVGIMLLDFPGKRRLVKKAIGRPRVLKALNAWRHRFGKPPFVLDTTPMGPKPPGICGGIPPPGLPSSASDPCGVAMSCADPRESERRP
jgi:hypothetical protein